jgi:hypothetical protein
MDLLFRRDSGTIRLISCAFSLPSFARFPIKIYMIFRRFLSKLSKVSPSQADKQIAMKGPRFEQTRMDLQPNPLPAIDLIAQAPVQKVASRKIHCDGGGNFCYMTCYELISL